jgi:hypothetical protein
VSRHSPALSTDQADLADMLDAVLTDVGEPPTDADPDGVAALRWQLAELGVWTLGAASDDEAGADDELAAVAFARLGRRLPALGWAAVQAHAAVELLGPAPLAGTVRSGEVAVAVVDEASPAVHLAVREGRVRGRVDRVDPAGERPHVVVLGNGSALVLPPESLRCTPLRRTGLDGALTARAELAEPVAESDIRVEGVDTGAARVRLRLGAAAVAAGIADAAAEAALAYSGEREQFGAPLTALPTVRDALFAASGGAATALRQVLRPRDCTPWQAAAVLDTACEQAIDTCARAVQAHGGYGYLAEYAVERMLRDAVSLRAACDVTTARRTAAAELTTGRDRS